MASTPSLASVDDEEATYTEESLMAMTKAQLLVLAAELGVEGVTSANTKQQISDAILEVTNV